MKFLKRLFGQKIKYQEPIPYIEKDTKCDLCDLKDQCDLIEVTMLADTRQHYASGLGNDCKKINNVPFEV